MLLDHQQTCPAVSKPRGRAAAKAERVAVELELIAEREKREWLKAQWSGKNFNLSSFNFDITETCSEIGMARLAACSYDYIINET